LWAGDLARYTMPWLVLDALLGSIFCFGLYLAATSWGLRARRPLVVLASSTFGAAGSEWLCGIGVAVAAVLWYAIALNFAVDTTLLGLRTCRLMQPSAAAPLWQASAFAIKSPVYLCTALFWVYITRTAIKMQLSGVVVALMKFYAPIALLL